MRGVANPARHPALEQRKEALERLSRALDAREGELIEALHDDLGKSAAEAYASEIGYVQTDIAHALRHLSRWTRPRRRPATWGVRPASQGGAPVHELRTAVCVFLLLNVAAGLFRVARGPTLAPNREGRD